jgi:hypothetical protein
LPHKITVDSYHPRSEIPQRASWRQADQSSVLEIPWLDLKHFGSDSITIVGIELMHRTGKVISKSASFAPTAKMRHCLLRYIAYYLVIWRKMSSAMSMRTIVNGFLATIGILVGFYLSNNE